MPGGSALEIDSSSLSGSMQHPPRTACLAIRFTYEFLHFAAASALRWLTGQLPWRKTRALRLLPDRMFVAAERCTEYTALSIGYKARLAFLTALGVTARFTARPGCTARRNTPRNEQSREETHLLPPGNETSCPERVLPCASIRRDSLPARYASCQTYPLRGGNPPDPSGADPLRARPGACQALTDVH